MASELVLVEYRPRGVLAELFLDRSPELLVSGPAGTGKSRAVLEKIHLLCSKYGHIRVLICRKTLRSLVASVVVTYRERVLHPLDGVRWFGGSGKEPPAFHYPNGSSIVLGGMDKADKVLSTEYDVIYPNEATELSENDWETLNSRLRNNRLSYQQIIGDCNPSAPYHWLKRRVDRGAVRLLESHHEDNPSLWDASAQRWTPDGAKYIERLDALTGVRYLRLRLGRWAAAEGQVFESWDRSIHVIAPFKIPPDWPVFWVVDFGFTNPFCWQAFAVSPDGDLYLFREIYKTRTIVEDHCKTILRVMKGVQKPGAIVCDHDAEDRATFERHIGMRTIPAFKAVTTGIQAVEARLRPDGPKRRPRLMIFSDCLVERDPLLESAIKPCCSVEEVDNYRWPRGLNGQPLKEQPIKEDDHGMDCWRYAVAHADKIGRRAPGQARSYQG